MSETSSGNSATVVKAFNDIRRPKRGMVVRLHEDAYVRFRPKDPNRRPWVIVQADWVSEKAPYVIIAPLTTWKSGDPKSSGSKNVYVLPPFVKEPSFILCGELQTVEIDDIKFALPEGDRKPKVPKPVLEDLAYALQCVLGVVR